jgi:hypothetical protein
VGLDGKPLAEPHPARVEAAERAAKAAAEAPQTCALDPECAEWREGRCALQKPGGDVESCPDCPCGDCPDDHDHGKGCPCPEAVARAKELQAEAEAEGEEGCDGDEFLRGEGSDPDDDHNQGEGEVDEAGEDIEDDDTPF